MAASSGRMLALAARAMGYRIWVLDPDPDCPAASVADRVIVGSYDDVEAALRLAAGVEVVTYELEHVAAEVVEALEARLPVRPGHGPLTVTQDRLAERRFVESAGGRGRAVARGSITKEARIAAASSACRSGSSCRSAATTVEGSCGSRASTSCRVHGQGWSARPAPRCWPSVS